MSTTSIVGVIVVAVLVIAALVYWVSPSNTAPAPTPYQGGQTTEPTPQPSMPGVTGSTSSTSPMGTTTPAF